MFLRRFSHVVLIVISIWVLYLFFTGIKSLSLENWDEAFYADTIRSMVKTHNFVVPYWNQEPFIDKPPLYFWIGSVFSVFFGLAEISYRLPSVFACLAILVLVAWYVTKKYGYQYAIIPVLWLISNLLFVSRGKGGNLDSMATLFILISYLILVSKSKKKYFYFGIAAGLVYLTKASLSFYLFIILFVELWLNKNDLKGNIINVVIAVGCYVLTIGLWIIPLYFREGLVTVKYFLFNSDQGVGHLSIKSINTDYLYFLRESLSSIFLLPSYIGFIFMIPNFRKNLVFFLYSFLLLVLLTLSPIHNNWYLFPILPFWSISSAFFFKQLLKALKKEYVQIGFTILVFSLLYQHVVVYTRSLKDIITSRSTTDQARAAEFASKYRKSTTMFVRLDEMYPVSVYYSKGRVLFSPSNSHATHGMYISNDDLIKILKTNQTVILLGSIQDITTLKQQYLGISDMQKFGNEVVATN